MRFNLPRSNPTTTSPSMTMTGVDMYPRAFNSSMAEGSTTTFLSRNGTPLRERNSFAASQDVHPLPLL